MVDKSQRHSARFNGEAGIAIGPILFVVAILGILAAAIAAGSGSFTGNSNTEAARTQAAALIQIGQNLKVGADRLSGLGYGEDGDLVMVTDEASTVNDNDLFSPSGGGVGIPSRTMAENSNEIWHYSHHNVLGMGTAATERVAFLKVKDKVCEQVNEKANGLKGSDYPIAATASLANDVGDVANDGSGVGWPIGLTGFMTGCLKGTGTSTGYYYYQVLTIR